MQVDVTPLSAGAFSFFLHVDSNDPVTPTYDINVGDNAAPGGEIDIQRPAGVSNSIADGGTSNVTGAIAGVQSILTFTIENLGTGD
ncbi:MAG: hypothetical protein KDB29_13705, partial [Planctomycetes bacterium]|nr:hypothetical protein [Planctomycetota bacterium]